MNSNEISYLAGIIDGEGSIVIYKHARKDGKKIDYGGFITVVNTSQTLILWLCKNVGGTWCIHARQGLHNRECYKWSQYGNEALLTIVRVMPYLVVKLARAELFVKFYGSINESKDKQAGLSETAILERDYFIQEMRKLTGGGETDER